MFPCLYNSWLSGSLALGKLTLQSQYTITSSTRKNCLRQRISDEKDIKFFSNYYFNITDKYFLNNVTDKYYYVTFLLKHEKEVGFEHVKKKELKR